MNPTVSVLLLGIISTAALVLVLYWSQRIYRNLLVEISGLLQKSLDQNQKLVGIIASRDPMTAVAITETLSPSPETTYVPMSDEAEAARYQQMSGSQGLGEALYDDDAATDLTELGIGGENSII